MLSRHALYFITVADHGNLVGAADSLGVTQSALSRSIQLFETSLGAQLFNRSRRGMTLTVYGETVLRHVRTVANTDARVKEDLAALRGMTLGRLAVGAGPSIAGGFLSGAINRLLNRYPNVEVFLYEGLTDGLLTALQQGQVEFVIGAISPDVERDSLRRELLFHDEVVPVTRPKHPLQLVQRVTIEQLAAYRWVLPARQEWLREAVIELFGRHGLKPPIPKIETNSTASMKSFTAQGDYVTYLPRNLIEMEVNAGLLSPILTKGCLWRRQVSAVFRTHTAPSPTAQLLVRIVKQICASPSSRRGSHRA